MKITVFSLPTCPRCDQLKDKLRSKGIEFEVIDDPEVMLDMGIKGNLPLLQVDDGEKLPFFKAIPWIDKNIIKE